LALTVVTDMNAAAATSLFVPPCATNSAIRRSVGVRASDALVRPPPVLPDAGRALDDERARPRVDADDESLERLDLGLSPDDLPDIPQREAPPPGQRRTRGRGG